MHQLTLLLFTAGCSLRRILSCAALGLLLTLTARISALLLILGCTILVLTTGVSTLLLTVLCCRVWLACVAPERASS